MRKPTTEEKKASMIEVGKRLNAVRKNAGLSLSDIAERLNRDFGANTNKGMISKYENGIHEPSASTIYCLSKILGVSSDYILGKTDVMCAPAPLQGVETTGFSIKVYKSLTAPDVGEQDESVTEIIPTSWMVGGREYFGYRVPNGRLAPRYFTGDIIIFERKSKPKKDQTCIVSMDGTEAFLARVTNKREGKTIAPLDPILEENYYTTAQLLEKNIKIFGIAAEVRRSERV
ncbi:MAG: helix-turn-helix transcriptional regulator [Clostridia bacterium]|nr:helix-turn-helix transcriptional regulator [Oscillospiraceae bacterium]MBQ6796764.1 helix-turn-helix transcriptional regulator [Clostridia bacterium]